MRLSESSIRRPVLACVMSLLLVLIGLVSASQLSLREYPRIDEPLVNVTTVLQGASSEVVESQVTKPLEDSIAGIDGVDIITSVSRAERSQITVQLQADRRTRTPRRPRCATARRACAGGCPTRSTSRSSPRSKPTRRRRSGSPTRARRWARSSCRT